jgi:hypothetical protein
VTDLAFPVRTAARYVQPLREGGSLPAIVETDDGALFVVKFRGAGQGAKALLAELIVGALAGPAGLPVPELSLIDIPPQFGRSEPDPEIQDLLRASHGINVGMRYLDGAFNFDLSAAGELLPPGFASRLVWFDAFLTNPDRTVRNPNLLIWERTPWLIDHGAAIYAHHAWSSGGVAADVAARAGGPFARVHEHILLPLADDLAGAEVALRQRLTPEVIGAVTGQLPDALLGDPLSGFTVPPATARANYQAYLTARLAASPVFTADAIAARDRLLQHPPRTLAARR